MWLKVNNKQNIFIDLEFSNLTKNGLFFFKRYGDKSHGGIRTRDPKIHSYI